MKLLASVAAGILVSVCTYAATEKATPETPFRLIDAAFGVLNSEGSPNPGFRKTATVPLVAGQRYGWVIRLETRRPKVRWREEFTLPTAPETWGPGERDGRQNLSVDRRTSIVEREVAPERGLIGNFWEVAPGDPKGKYVIRVLVEGHLVSTFEFEVK